MVRIAGAMAENTMEIKRIDYDFSVCKVEDYSLAKLDSEYCFIGKTDEEKYSIDRYAGKWKKHDRRIARKGNQLSVYRR